MLKASQQLQQEIDAPYYFDFACLLRRRSRDQICLIFFLRFDYKFIPVLHSSVIRNVYSQILQRVSHKLQRHIVVESSVTG